VLDTMRRRAAELGLRHMFAPVQPMAKALEPFTPMAGYIARTREDGLPTEPLLRVHIRAGGRIEKIAPTSMVIPSTITNWRRWIERICPPAVPSCWAPSRRSTSL
jgi:hypothetical protein